MFDDFNITVFVLGIAAILLTPGPTNTLLAAAGNAQGTRKALPLIACELVGYLIAISTWGILLIPAQRHAPWLAMSVRIASSIYLAYTSVKVWRAARAVSIAEKKSIGPKGLFIATLLNPKGLLFASAIFPAHAFENILTYSIAMTLFSCLLVPIGTLWIRFGAEFGSGRLKGINPINFQRLAALAIGLFSATIAWAAFHLPHP
jgi:threonine/homoserine/homoserine lactone efflux protein